MPERRVDARWLLLPALLGLLVLLAFGLRQDPSEIPSPLVGQPVPALHGEDLAGEPRALAASGRPMVLNVWASWCVACATEHEALMAAYRRFGDRVEFVGLNYRDQRDDGIAWLRRSGDPYTWVFHDPQGRAGIELGVYGVPETFFIDTAGIIVGKHVGPVDLALLERRVNELLDAG